MKLGNTKSGASARGVAILGAVILVFLLFGISSRLWSDNDTYPSQPELEGVPSQGTAP